MDYSNVGGWLCVAAGLLVAAAIPLFCRSRLYEGFRCGRGPAFCDLLEYAALAEDNVIVLKSGGLCAVYRIRLADLSLLPDSQVEHIHEMLHSAIMKAGGDYCLHFDLVRSADRPYAPFRDWSDEVLDDIESMKSQAFAKRGCFSSEMYLTITCMAQEKMSKVLERLFVRSDDSEALRRRADRIVKDFRIACDCITETLALSFELKPAGVRSILAKDRLSSAYAARVMGEGHRGIDLPYAECRISETLSFLRRCITGRDVRTSMPEHAAYLDALLSTEDFSCGMTPRIGEMYVCVVAVEGLPDSTMQGMLDRLACLPFAYRFSSRFVCFSSVKSQSIMTMRRRFWMQKTTSMVSQIFNSEGTHQNRHAVNMADDAYEAEELLQKGEAVFGSYTANVILHAKSKEELNLMAADTVHLLEDLGIGARVETVNAMEAFMGSLPGHFRENLRCSMVSDDVLIDLLPLSLPSQGEREAPNRLYGEHRSPLMQVSLKGCGAYCLNLHEKDLGNTLVFGPSGAGKSVLLGELMLNLLRYKDMRVMAFDRGHSFYALCRALGGTHIELDSEQSMLCPLADLETGNDFEYAFGYVKELARLNGIECTPDECAEIRRCLSALSAGPATSRSLSDLHMLLAEPRIKSALGMYISSERRRSIIDGDRNFDVRGRLTVFECTKLFGAGNGFSEPVLRQIFHLFEGAFDGRPSAVVVDEAWLMLNDPYFAGELVTWFKTLRKFNSLVILATQSLSDLSGSPVFSAVLDCAKTRIFLPNSDAGSPVMSEGYKDAGLNAKEIGIVAKAVPKRDFYFTKGAERTMFSLMLPEDELNLLSFAGDACRRQVEELYGRYGRFFYKRRAGCGGRVTEAEGIGSGVFAGDCGAQRC